MIFPIPLPLGVGIPSMCQYARLLPAPCKILQHSEGSGAGGGGDTEGQVASLPSHHSGFNEGLGGKSYFWFL